MGAGEVDSISGVPYKRLFYTLVSFHFRTLLYLLLGFLGNRANIEESRVAQNGERRRSPFCATLDSSSLFCYNAAEALGKICRELERNGNRSGNTRSHRIRIDPGSSAS